MQKFAGVAFYKQTPMLRLLLFLAAGIIVQQYTAIAVWYSFIGIAIAIIALALYTLFSISLQFKYSWITGAAIGILLLALGNLIGYKHSAENNKNWIGHQLSNLKAVNVIIKEPLIEKEKSYKAIATVQYALTKNTWSNSVGNIVLYFNKDSAKPFLSYGSQIIIYKPLQAISNSKNPGAFNYRQYALFQNIGAQVFLNPSNYELLYKTNSNPLAQWLNDSRLSILQIIKKYIPLKKEQGIAEALLIGYKNDLDRDVVQAYSNTGVVHIIAISGLHIAMIYGLLIAVFRPLGNKKTIRLIKAICTLFILWIFTCIAGNAPSILRSTIMFSGIIIGELFNKKMNTYNNLAASAFVILLFQPFSLWDVGFQLSYAAVLSISIFAKPIQHTIHFQNKLLQLIWELIAITLSAQILTFPIIVYHFHQFPTLFLFSNLLAVPLSAFILYCELALLIFSPFTSIATFIGTVAGNSISLLNNFIDKINTITLAQITGIQINLVQTFILFGCIAGIAYWLMHKNKRAFIFSLATVAIFYGLRSWDLFEKNNQQKLIVYNIPKHQAMDIIEGIKYQFIGDTILQQDGFLRNFHLQPARILHRTNYANRLNSISFQNNIISSSNKNIIVLQQNILATQVAQKIKVDAIIISKNPKLYISQIHSLFDCDYYIFDATNPLWKINKWKKDCDSLHLRHYSVPEQGAFEINL